MKRVQTILSVLLVGSLLAACQYQKANTIEQADVQKGNKTVYGVSPDSAAVQLKDTWTEKEGVAQRAEEIREKLLGLNGSTHN
ncbi:MAG: hypothetical protein QM669_06985 [Siphonobacter sp.]